MKRQRIQEAYTVSGFCACTRGAPSEDDGGKGVA